MNVLDNNIGSKCAICCELQKMCEALAAQQSRTHAEIERAEQARNQPAMREFKLDAYEITAQLRDSRTTLARHLREAHTTIKAA